ALTVLKKEKADAIRLVDQVKKRMEELKPNLDNRVQISFVNDISFFIRNRLGILSGNLFVGLALVLIVLAMILPLRVAFLVSLGIPFSFFGTIFLFDTWDLSLNLISMMGLIIVVGMLVDDAIVV